MSFQHSDQPINSAKEDKLARATFAKQISQLCTQKKSTSTVIGIYGKWGEGKSSVLNLVSQELEESILQIQFNPWFFKGQEDLLKFFFTTLGLFRNLVFTLALLK